MRRADFMTRAVFGDFGPIRPTRFRDLRYQRRVDHWRLLSPEGRGIGPLYGSEAELAADVDRMADVSGYR